MFDCDEGSERKPDVFVNCMFGGDAIACINQAQQLGLSEECTIFNTWITNVVATGIPEEALNGLYALEYYYGMAGFEDQELVEQAQVFTQAHVKMWNEPPDAYGSIAYVSCQALFEAAQKTGSFETEKISKALAESKFGAIKGEVNFREDHEMVSKYLAFLVKGKASSEKHGKYDVFTIERYFGGEEALSSLELMKY